jgi:hypothetical protein
VRGLRRRHPGVGEASVGAEAAPPD